MKIMFITVVNLSMGKLTMLILQRRTLEGNEIFIFILKTLKHFIISINQHHEFSTHKIICDDFRLNDNVIMTCIFEKSYVNLWSLCIIDK